MLLRSRGLRSFGFTQGVKIHLETSNRNVKRFSITTFAVLVISAAISFDRTLEDDMVVIVSLGQSFQDRLAFAQEFSAEQVQVEITWVAGISH